MARENLDLEVIFFRDQLSTMIKNSPLPITVKSMILDRIIAQVKDEEEATINHLLNSGGSDINANDYGRTEEEALLRTDENLLTGQQLISTGTEQSNRNTSK